MQRYVFGNPVSYSDASGLRAWPETGGIVTAKGTHQLNPQTAVVIEETFRPKYLDMDATGPFLVIRDKRVAITEHLSYYAPSDWINSGEPSEVEIRTRLDGNQTAVQTLRVQRKLRYVARLDQEIIVSSDLKYYKSLQEKVSGYGTLIPMPWLISATNFIISKFSEGEIKGNNIKEDSTFSDWYIAAEEEMTKTIEVLCTKIVPSEEGDPTRLCQKTVI